MITTTLWKPVFWKKAEIFRWTLGEKRTKVNVLKATDSAKGSYFSSKWNCYFRSVLNLGPFACKVNVMTTTLQKPAVMAEFVFSIARFLEHTNQTADCVALFNLQLFYFSSKPKKSSVLESSRLSFLHQLQLYQRSSSLLAAKPL